MSKTQGFNNNLSKETYLYILYKYVTKTPLLQNKTPQELNSLFQNNIFPSSFPDCFIESELPQPQSLHELALLWEKSLDSLDTGKNKKDGAFFTPKPIVEYIVRDSLSSTNDNPYIIDPACGSGIFLLEVANTLSKKCKTTPQRREIIENSIFGIDINQDSVEICRTLLLYFFILETGDLTSLPNLKNNIIQGNSLLSPQDSRTIKNTINWKEAFPCIKKHNGFDCIIGNPPYGLKRDNQLSNEENEALLEKYSTTRSGKINKYLAFMANSYDHLAPKGVLSFIVPNSWLGIDGGEKIRKQFLTDGALEKLIIFQKPVFKNIGVETIIFRAVKKGNLKNINIYNAKDKDNIPSKPSYNISNKICLEKMNSRIPTIWDDETEKLFLHLNEHSQKLSDLSFIPYIALQAYATGHGTPPQTSADVKNHVFHSKTKSSDEYIPYLEGKDIQRYNLNWSGNFLRHGIFLSDPQPLIRYTQPRIILREILNPLPYILMATYTDAPYLYNKSVLHIIHKEQDKEALLALLAILNSKTASTILLIKGRKSQRQLFPKIVARDLQEFPLPNNFLEIKSNLANLALKMLAKVDTSIETKINKIVAEAYH